LPLVIIGLWTFVVSGGGRIRRRSVGRSFGRLVGRSRGIGV